MNIDDPKNVAESIGFIQEHFGEAPSIALVLGSGLGDFAETLDQKRSIPTSDIPHYPRSTVEGHKGHIVFGYLGKRAVAAFQGRVHLYESNAKSALYPMRVAARLGITEVIITNAAGGINRAFQPGDLMLITDQLNLTLESGNRRRDERKRSLSEIYSTRLGSEALSEAEKLGISLRKGIYAGVKGPSYETASEVEMIRRAGGDAVGMSTVLETGYAASAGIEVLGISCITNYATGITSQKLTHKEVTDVGRRVKKVFSQLLTHTIQAM